MGFHCYTGGAERYAPYVEPMIRIEYRDVVPLAGFDTSLTARWGYRPLKVGDFAFGSAKALDLPHGAEAFGADCAVLARDNEDRYRRAQALMRRVLEMAHERGIQMAMGFEFGIHPPEFASIVPPDSWIRGAMLPDPTHPASIEILRATIDDILAKYPGIDWIWLWLHEHTMHVGQAKPSGAFQIDLRERGRSIRAGRERGSEVHGRLVAGVHPRSVFLHPSEGPECEDRHRWLGRRHATARHPPGPEQGTAGGYRLHLSESRTRATPLSRRSSPRSRRTVRSGQFPGSKATGSFGTCSPA